MLFPFLQCEEWIDIYDEREVQVTMMRRLFAAFPKLKTMWEDMCPPIQGQATDYIYTLHNPSKQASTHARTHIHIVKRRLPPIQTTDIIRLRRPSPPNNKALDEPWAKGPRVSPDNGPWFRARSQASPGSGREVMEAARGRCRGSTNGPKPSSQTAAPCTSTLCSRVRMGKACRCCQVTGQQV